MAVVTSAVAVGVGAAAAVAGTAYSIHKSEKESKKADRARKRAEDLQLAVVEEFDELEKEIPSVASRLYKLQQLKSVGNLTPEMEQAIQQEETALKQIQVDPAYKQAQFRTLAKLREVSDSGGLNPVMKAQLAKVRSEIASAEKASREAILQRASQMGTLTGGQVVNSQLLAQQQGANREAEAGTAIAAEAYKNALSAMQAEGELAGKMQAQDYGQQRDLASASDLINRFNTEQQASTQARNVAQQNAAKQYNLMNDQRIADTNTSQANEEARNEASAASRQFEDKLRVKAAKAGQYGNMASTSAAEAAAAAAAASNRDSASIGGIMKIGGGLLDYGLKGMGGTSTPTTPSGSYMDSTNIYGGGGTSFT